MKFGVIITGGPVTKQIELAKAAEAAGWDGVFTWDGIHVGDGMEVHDPWVLMSAFAMATERVRIGAIIQPLARRRPWKVAREAVTLDHVSNGRFVLCVGLGALRSSPRSATGSPSDEASTTSRSSSRGRRRPMTPPQRPRWTAGPMPATWWIESDWENLDPAVARRRIEAGPPPLLVR